MDKQSKYELVKKFMEIIKEPYSETPTNISEKDAHIRYLLLKEENEEYLEAAKKQDLEKVLDAITDILYVVHGTVLKHGLQDYIDDAFIEVHKSNMSKKDPNGNEIKNPDTGKVTKGTHYIPPDLKKVLNKNINKLNNIKSRPKL